MAVYLLVFFGSMAMGSILWGALSSEWGIPSALVASSAGLVLGIGLVPIFRIETDEEIDHAPSMHWPAPIVAEDIEAELGPVMVLIEYRIDPADAGKFATAMRQMGRVRRRDGAAAWGLFRDAADPERFVEHFITPSWVEHLRQHERITVSDRQVQERVQVFHVGETPPLVSHFIAEPVR